MNSTSFKWGHAVAVVPPMPWPKHKTALCRNKEIKRIWERPVANFPPLTPTEKQAFLAEVNQLPRKQRKAIMRKAMSLHDEGRLEGFQDLVCRQLRKLFGDLNVAAEAKVTALSPSPTVKRGVAGFHRPRRPGSLAQVPCAQMILASQVRRAVGKAMISPGRSGRLWAAAALPKTSQPLFAE